MSAGDARNGHGLWALTSYFNPMGWRSRLENYRCFRKHLQVPLVTVEWHPSGKFQLADGDADVLVQIQGGDLMWQKERLLSISMAHVPAGIDVVAWLDCDLVLTDPRWPQAATRALAEHRAVQLFSEVRYLDRPRRDQLVAGQVEPAEFARCAPGDVKPSSARLIQRAGIRCFAGFHTGIPGMAWAARRSTLAESGLFDRAIIGSGDFFWLVGALGIAADWLAAREHLGWYRYLARSSYAAWAGEAHAAIDGRVGFVDSSLLHLYHGEIANRHYFDRHAPINRLGIDIDRDIAPTADGAWRFERPQPAWRDMMRRYFLERREDDA